MTCSIFGMGRAVIVDESLVVLTDRIDDQSVAFVMADRFAVPGRFRILRMRHIGIDVPDLLVALEDDQNLLRPLNEVERAAAIA